MNRLIERSQQNLAQVEGARVGRLRLDERIEQLVRDRLASLEVLGHAQQRLARPAPILQHLGWRLHEVALNTRATVRKVTNYKHFKAFFLIADVEAT